MTDHDADRGSEYAELLASLDEGAETGDHWLVEDDLAAAAAATRALEAKVREGDEAVKEMVVECQREIVQTAYWRAHHDKLRADRDRLAAEVERIRVQFDEAVYRLKDMFEADDGQAFKEAGKFLLRIKGHDHEA